MTLPMTQRIQLIADIATRLAIAFAAGHSPEGKAIKGFVEQAHTIVTEAEEVCTVAMEGEKKGEWPPQGRRDQGRRE